MSVNITFNNIVKKYGDTTVIPELSLEIQKGEFFTLLGPSGCGKTTLLRMVAGFNSIEGGTLEFNGRVMNQVAPNKRNIGMVFQNYAIFPHMSVSGNVAFGLQTRKVNKQEIAQRVEEILKVVQIEAYKDRMPKNLSGGQQQRVALARAIVIRPDVLLMDEPLSNLDAKLRIEMREAIKQIQREVGITTVYVTHDQEEAMAVSDRIAVMKSGVIQHLGTPREIYRRPSNLFVATFIGRTNILDARMTLVDGAASIDFGNGYSETIPGLKTNSANPNVKLSVRPEEFKISNDGTGIPGVMRSSSFLGMHTHLLVELTNGQQVEVISEGDDDVKLGDQVRLKIDPRKVNVYDETGEHNFTSGVGV